MSSAVNSHAANAPPGPHLAPPEPHWYERPEYQVGAFVPLGESNLTDQGRVMSSMLTRRQGNGIIDLPAFPQQIIQLLELLKNANVDYTNIVKCLRADPVVAAEVLRFANSALYAPTDRIVDLRHAISFLGVRRMHALALGIATKVASGNVVHPRLHRHLWSHSVGCGVMSMLLARELHSDAEAAFLSGLLHDVGKIAVAAEVSRLQKKLIINLSDVDLLALLEIHHVGLGRSLAQHWRLPDLVMSVVSHHHNLDEVPERDAHLVALVQFADMVCYAVGLGAPALTFDILGLPVLERLDIDSSRARAILDSTVPRLYAEISELS
jgi:putative nucleotidyltransferase with HDIG domain